jgi:hypothetical protein
MAGMRIQDPHAGFKMTRDRAADVGADLVSAPPAEGRR